MTFATGTRLDFFEIISLLGAGGMGEVYRARDTRLSRDVAIKVLPEAFAADPERLARFQREAQVLASLSHPNIGVIHGIHESGGARFLVLELIEGEALAERLKRGPIPLEDAVELLKQIAAALEAAHEKGILHRDLKPANIQITPDGVVKVLDFGLAKMMQTETEPQDISNSPTLSVGQTAGGMILGTAAYMSPEQARGRTVDKRTDVWAFGCVAYEMLTGRQAFAGETVTDIIASVMKAEPDWSRLPAGTAATLRLLLRQCLNKQARHRLHDIADARIVLEDAGTEPNLPSTAAAPSTLNRRWILSGFVAVLLIGTVIGSLATRKPAPLEPMRFQFSLEQAEKLVASITSVRPSRTAIAVHPNGKMIVFNADAKGSPPQLYLRELSKSEVVPIPGTQEARGPFFSPDGQWIGFFANGQIKKVPLAGGPAVVICSVSPDTRGLSGASWADDGTIYFSDRGEGISKVPAAGGTPAKVTTSDAAHGELHVLPQGLPGGKTVIFTSVIASQWERARIVAQSLEAKDQRELIQGGADARYVSTGHLVFMRTGALMAVPFDLKQLRVTGEPIALVEGVMQAVNSPNGADETGSGQFAISDSGTLVYATGGTHPLPESSLVWLDRKKGAAEPVTWAPLRAYRSPRLSPDQSKVVLLVFGPSRTNDVWVYDTVRGAPTRLTFKGNNWPAIWSPDGKRVLFASDESGVKNLYLANADGSGPVERLTTSDYDQVPSSWSAQNNTIAFLQFQNDVGSQIWVLPMDGDRKPKLFIESRVALRYPEFSPDGRWIAYVSPESGTFQVYVQPYPGPGEKHRVSSDEGTQPIWSANGREILFRGNAQQFFAASITSFSPFQTEAPRLVYAEKSAGYSSTTPIRSWDATSDGQRFMVTRDEESKDKPVTQLQIVLNWTEELKRRVPAK
jgi:serine/threonine protein kinase/dipeptidyl aminopeptidase/acylaminoacyl peptidase